jgi:hypothetical protein
MNPSASSFSQGRRQTRLTIEVVTKSERAIRVTAQRIVRGPLSEYEQRDYNGGLWRDRSSELPSANGFTEERCLRMALGFIDDTEHKQP